MQANTEVLKEPRGFIKLIEIIIEYGDLYSAPSKLLLRSAPNPSMAEKSSFEILAICAFATAVGPHIAVSFTCCGSRDQVIQLSMQYPYRVSEFNATAIECHCPVLTTAVHTSEAPTGMTSISDATPTTPPKGVETTTAMSLTEFQLPGECKSSSEFYVFVGVTAFLFSLAAVVFYVFAQDRYAGFVIIPKADFIVTIFFTLFWLISSSAFAAALSKIKYSTDPAWISAHHSDFFPQCFSGSCASNEDGNYSTLNVSVIFGFLNMIVWGGNNWFLYKETNWFGTTDSSSSLPSQSMPTSTSEIQPKV